MEFLIGTRKISKVTQADMHSGPPALITGANRTSLAPFVLFDAGALTPSNYLAIDWHPHSGVATVTFPFGSDMHHGDSAGNFGTIRKGGIQWMASGKGVWHREEYEPENGNIGIHQLWVLLPPEEENAPVNYFNAQPEEITLVEEGDMKTQVILGEFNGKQSVMNISQNVVYLNVEMPAGSVWKFTPDTKMTRGFVFPRAGSVIVGNQILAAEDFGQFEETNKPLEILAQSDSQFVVALAEPWPYPIIRHYGQMHTSKEALINGSREIEELGRELELKIKSGNIKTVKEMIHGK